MFMSLLFLMCTVDDTVADRIQQQLYLTPITYCMGGTGPKCYDCGGIITKAIKSIGLQPTNKFSSHYALQRGKKVPFTKARRGQYLVLTSPKTHIAFISRGYDPKNRTVKIYDYVENKKRATERSHSYMEGVYVVDMSSELR